MRALLRIVSWVLLFASLGAAAAAWFTPTPELDADDAAELATTALTRAGIASELTGPPTSGVHVTEQDEEIPAWFVPVRAHTGGRSAEIELRVQRSAGRLVFVDDLIEPERVERLLSDEQFDALGEHRDDTLADRWVLRNLLAAVAGAVIAATAYVLATRSEPLWSTP